MRDAFIDLLKAPTAENYLAVSKRISEHPSYEPYDNGLENMNSLLAVGDHKGAIAKFGDLMPNWLLSPGIHMLQAVAYKRTGREKEFEVEMQIAFTLITAILATGDGSQARPYTVNRTRDEYDVLMHLKKEPAGQALHQKDGRHYDSISCDDGTEIWFDITVPYEHMRKQMGG